MMGLGSRLAAALAVAGTMALTGCTGTVPAQKPAAPNPARATTAGAIAGSAALGAGSGATGVLDENYLYDRHEQARKQAPANPTTGRAAPNPPWASGP